MHSFYVYYKVEAAAHITAHAAVMRLLLELQTSGGTTGRLLQRVDDASTWMEIYEEIADPERFKSALEAAVLRSGLLAYIANGQRHMEHFKATGTT